jgi:adenylate kinase family enzyme
METGTDGVVRLADLGERICILGPSNSGKSTLAATIAAARGIPVVHLDQLYHYANSDWQARPRPEFLALHESAIQVDRWVMDGNYSKCFPQRFARATGLILLDVPTWTSLARYFRRTLLEPHSRAGGLEGGKDSVKWTMIRHIAVVTPGGRSRYAQIFRASGLPKIALPSARDIDLFYKVEGLHPVQPGRQRR